MYSNKGYLSPSHTYQRPQLTTSYLQKSKSIRNLCKTNFDHVFYYFVKSFCVFAFSVFSILWSGSWYVSKTNERHRPCEKFFLTWILFFYRFHIFPDLLAAISLEYRLRRLLPYFFYPPYLWFSHKTLSTFVRCPH